MQMFKQTNYYGITRLTYEYAATTHRKRVVGAIAAWLRAINHID
jgi:hypothetical protein